MGSLLLAGLYGYHFLDRPRGTLLHHLQRMMRDPQMDQSLPKVHPPQVQPSITLPDPHSSPSARFLQVAFLGEFVT